MIPENIDEKDFKYALPQDDWFISRKREIEQFVNKCKIKAGLERYEIEVNYLLLFNIFIRIDERSDYYKYFHSKEEVMKMSLEKEVALTAYWITKYKPFCLKNVKQEEDFYFTYKCTISDVLATMLIVFFLCKREPTLKNFFTEKKINTLIYDLFNRDISKEAMIMYVESFVKIA